VSELIEGLYPKPKHANAPDFVIGKLSINLEQFMPYIRQWCKDHPGENWMNIDMKESKGGRGYAVEDTWKPEKDTSPPAPAQAAQDEFSDGEIPF
jgi:hypothetical protein